MLKRFLKLAGIAALAVVMTCSLTGCGKEKIGVVDAEKVIAESTLAKEMQDKLNTASENATKELQAMAEAGKSDEELATAQQASYNKLMAEKQTIESKMDEALRKAIEKAAQEKKLDTVLFKKDVRYGGTDITAEVSKYMNENAKSADAAKATEDNKDKKAEDNKATEKTDK